MILWFLLLLSMAGGKTDLPYCKNLARRYNTMHLKEFNFDSISYNNEKDIIEIDFWSKVIGSYSEDDGLKDMAKIRDKTIKYFIDNPDNELNNYKVCFTFHTYADLKMYMYNYDFQTSEMTGNSYDFLYFQDLECGDLSVLKLFSDAKRFNFFKTTRGYTEVNFYDDFKNLEYLAAPSHFTDEEIEYLEKTHPNCEIVK